MKQSAPPPHKALAATLRFPLPALFLALALCLPLLGPCAASASGALPWLAPGQQDNASANASNATGASASGSATLAPAAAVLPAVPPAKAADKSADEPADSAGKAQFEVLRQYFRRQLTLAEDFPEVFSRRVKSGEAMAFATMLEMQRRRGLLERFRAAEVDLSGLVFTRVTADPDLARIRVTGRYSFTLRPKALSLADPQALPAAAPDARTPRESRVHETLEEDALFVLLPEQGQWKIYERREGWRP